MSSGPQVYPGSTLIDEIDSHYEAVKARVLAVNSSRVFGGVVDARDWPFQQAQEGVFYLATDKGEPARSVNSWHSPLYIYTVNWVWLLIGTDIAQNAQQSNRGDRYRTHFQMQQEMLNGCWSGFCEKQKWGVTGSKPDGSAIVTGTPYVPSEKVWWGKPILSEKKDRTTGILFGYAGLRLSAFAPAISS